ncbi:hypothetical protein [Mycoplasma sp. Ms02]|uniref:hypothetical protein n=1 Tax=Mycoplasma sp. Ms02 TaxID=353851 RepID=UPI001C8AF7FD|nr:hypothetical protein [Mycoplasma sp. Ms02]QZE12125.1 hypothetical protein K4L35_02120 [Mycoplasma sp. Ms02]
MKKNFKTLLTGTGALAVLSASFLSASCGAGNSGSSRNEFAAEKQIIVAVDGQQKNFYAKVEELFKQTPSYKKGYRLSKIEKGVFDAVDFQTIGIADKQVPDVFYAPNDRVTTLVQANGVSDLDVLLPNVLPKLKEQGNLSDQDVENLRNFGNVEIVIQKKDGSIEPTRRFHAIRHNNEGIVLSSTKSLEETKAQLQNPDTDTLAELVAKGEALIRLQDFWYGNGILAGAFKAQDDAQGELIKKILYSEGAKISSGFLQGDKYHEKYKEALKIVSKLVYPIVEAAYAKNEEEYKETVWAKKGISQSDLIAVLDKDMGAVNNKIWQLQKEGKITYAIIGTWDVQASQKTAGTETFINVIPVADYNGKKVEYIQAPGSWSWLVNSRNNGSSQERKDAIQDLLLTINNVQSWKAYFDQDSKIPYLNKVQESLRTEVLASNAELSVELNKFAESIGYSNFTELYTSEQYASLKRDIAQVASTDFGSWSTNEAQDPLAEASRSVLPAVSPEIQTATELQKTVPLRNALAAIAGKTNVDDLTHINGAGEPWKIPVSKFNEKLYESEEHADFKKNTSEDPTNAHVRKVEKFIFGANGDNGDERSSLINSIVTALKNNKLNDMYEAVYAKAKTFAQLMGSQATEARIKEAAKLYFDGYVNAAKVRKHTIEVYLEKPALAKEGSNVNVGDLTVGKVLDKFSKYETSFAVNKVLNVISSTKPLSTNDGLGVFQTQPSRLDQGNPQFGKIWGIWNDNVFGNKQLYEKNRGKLTTEENFVGLIESQLNHQLGETVKALKQAKSSLYIEVSK